MNFNVSFKIFLEDSVCAYSWINKRLDNIKMHGTTVKMVGEVLILYVVRSVHCR